MRITVNDKRIETISGRECLPARNSVAGRLLGTKDKIKCFNSYLDNLQTPVYEAHRILKEAGGVITAEAIKNKLLGKSEKSRMLIDIFKEDNRKIAGLVGNGYAPGIILNKFLITFNHLI